MSKVTALILFTFTWIAFYAIYYNFIRPLLITRSLFKVNEIADEIDLLLIEGKAEPSDESIKILKRRVLKATNFIPVFDLTFMLMAFSHGHVETDAVVDAEKTVITKSSKDITKISERLDITMVTAFSANSPFLLTIVILLLFGAAVFSVMAKELEKKLSVIFWNVIYARSANSSSRPEGTLPAAC